jgi:hypothetical protein
MPTAFEAKEQRILDTPLLLVECRLRDGRIERWSTHRVTCEGATYEARVLRHSAFELLSASDQGVDTIPRVVVTLANADSRFSEIERGTGWKGAKMAVRFAFFDLDSGEPTTEVATVFQGIANPPDEITETTFRLSAANRMSMQRLALPQVRMQRRCPWDFPATAEQRTEAVHGGELGRHSRFFRCGYSPDVPDGVGNLSGSSAFNFCRYTRTDCIERGMFLADSSGRVTRRFGGCEFVPASIQVRSYGEKSSHLSQATSNEGRYNDFVPLVYGTAWFAPPVVLARNDGNLTHMEVLLGMGEIAGVLKVLVNDVEIPEGRSGTNMSGTGWFNLVSRGNRTGAFNEDFTDVSGVPSGDPYGSMAYLSLVVPNRVSDGRSLPTVKVLIEGLKLATYSQEGEYLGDVFSNNPAWVVLDLLMRCGWEPGAINLGSFAKAAAFCGEEIAAWDPIGNPITTPRFQCNLAIQRRRSAADAIRGVRNSARLFLHYGSGGKLTVGVENTLAAQQPERPAWSNATETLDGGWPSYEFDERSILRRANGEPSVRVFSRPTMDTPNRFAVEFQDAQNAYQQDSLALVDPEDVEIAGQEVTGTLAALGLPTFDQAARILKFNLDRSIQGNTYVEFETSVKAIGIQPGDVIALTYLKEGFLRQPLRVTRIAAQQSFARFSITAQIHKDGWYSDTNGQSSGAQGTGRQPGSSVGLPRPLIGNVTTEMGEVEFGIVEKTEALKDGGVRVELEVGFSPPPEPRVDGPNIPLLSLAPVVETSGGTLEGNQALYYAVSAVDEEGRESGLSFVTRASVPAGTNTNRVTLKSLSFSSATIAFHVYRGASPTNLVRIASEQSISATFTDAGYPNELAVPPDQNYDHANFYWRLEQISPMAATLHGPKTVGNNAMSLKPNEFRGMTVRITDGKGKGQERIVTENTATLLTVKRAWDVEPDGTSSYAVAESAWRFGASATASPVRFEAPNRGGAVVQVCGRAANVNDLEAPYELSTLTRWTIGGGGAGDQEPPPKPAFGIGLSPVVAGALELAAISFGDLTNTRSVHAGTVSLYYWNELDGPPPTTLANAVSREDDTIQLNVVGPAEAGAVIQCEAEIMRVEELLEGGIRYRVTRAWHGSEQTAHDEGAKLYHLRRKVEITPFPSEFFGSPTSGSWSHTIMLPDARVASCELFVTNSKGDSEIATGSLTGTTDQGLRTLSGGQMSFQIDGFLAVENGAAPDLSVDATHSVRDVFATVREAPVGASIDLALIQDDQQYCRLTIEQGEKISDVLDGFILGPIHLGSTLRLDVTGVGSETPGTDLNVVIRL